MPARIRRTTTGRGFEARFARTSTPGGRRFARTSTPGGRRFARTSTTGGRRLGYTSSPGVAGALAPRPRGRSHADARRCGPGARVASRA